MDTSKFNNFYRIESTRLKNWDYSKQGWYFITICVKDKKWSFGKIVNDEMKLSKIGEFAKKCWEEIPKHFENVKLRSFVVMPNHVHGVIDLFGVETLHATSLRKTIKLTTRKIDGDNLKFFSLISPKPNGCISTIIRSYKSAVSKICHDNNLNFNWQPRFYDVIIHDEYQLYFIEEYIKNNPKNWRKDPMNVNVKGIDWSKIQIELR